MQFGFAKVHHKITSRGKIGRGLGLEELPNIWCFPLIFLQRLKVATSKLAGWWNLTRPIIKSHPEEKKVWRWLEELLKFPFNIYAMAESIDFKFGTQLGGLIRPIIISHK